MNAQQQNLCACGCGTHARPGSRFRRGHNRRIRNRYLEQDCGYDTLCWVWQLSLGRHGYALEKRGPAGAQTSKLVSRRYYKDAHGPIPEGFHVDHLCRNRACVNPDHLEAVTPAENARRRPATRLTASAAFGIRLMRISTSLAAPAIGEAFGVAPTTVYGILDGRNWRLPGAVAPRG